MSVCEPLQKRDTQAAFICESLITDPAYAQGSFDSPQAVYQAAHDKALLEARANFERLTKTPPDQSFVFHSPWLQFLRARTDLNLPYIFDDLKETQLEDVVLLRQVAQARDSLKTDQGLVDFVKKTRGFSFKGTTDFVNRTALEALKRGEGNCLDFVNLYYGIRLLLGGPLELYDQHAPGVSAHVLARGASAYVDPEDDLVLQKPVGLTPMSPQTLEAYYYFNLAHSPHCLSQQGVDQATCRLEQAQKARRLDPGNFRVLYELGYLETKFFDPTEGLRLIQSSLKTNPQFEPALKALAALGGPNLNPCR